MKEIKVEENTLCWYALIDEKLYGNTVRFSPRDFPYIEHLSQAIGRDIEQCFKKVREEA